MLLFPYGKSALRLDEKKNHENQKKHGVSFGLAQLAFTDSKRVVAEDLIHSHGEKRYYCIGRVGHGVLLISQ